jgi:hypothetical protein
MAIIGRRPCPWCGFEHAHVKQNEGKLPYHHCPECGTMTPAKNGLQARLLTKDMRPIAGGPLLEPPKTDNPIIVPKEMADKAKAAAAAPAPAPAPRKPAGLWDSLMGKSE